MRTALRLTAPVLLVIALWRSEGLAALLVDVLGRVDLRLLALALVCNLAALAVGALRLRRLIAVVDADRPWTRCFADVLEATALNALLLMGTGELHRVARVRETTSDVAVASAIALGDRLLGALVLITFGGVAGLAFLPLDDVTAPALSARAALVLVGGGVVVTLSLALRHRTAPIIERLTPLRVGLTTTTAPPLVVLSVVIYGLWVLNVALLTAALGLDVPVTAIAYAAPAVTVAAYLPISIGGVGVREGGYALLLASYGVTPAEAIALGLLQYATFLVIAVLGAFSLARGRPRADA